jgi:CHAD domain-containing protein
MAKVRQPAEPAPALARALEQRVEDLRRLVRPALRSWDVDAVHHARVTTRRLSAALDLLRPLLSDDPRRAFAKSLRKLRRTLGALRDADVMLLHLEAIHVPPSCAAGVAWVSKHLGDRRAELRRQAARGPSAAKFIAALAGWVDLEHEVRESQETAGLLLRRIVPTQVRTFAEQADRVARPRHNGVAKQEASASSDHVHELRIAGKLLRYTLELAEPLGYDLPRSVTKDFKKLQDALGLWHDFAVLTEEMLRLALDAHLAARQPDICGSVLQLARVCWDKGQRHLERFRKLWAEEGAALSDRVLAAFSQPAGQVAHAGNGSERNGAPAMAARAAEPAFAEPQ